GRDRSRACTPGQAKCRRGNEPSPGRCERVCVKPVESRGDIDAIHPQPAARFLEKYLPHRSRLALMSASTVDVDLPKSGWHAFVSRALGVPTCTPAHFPAQRVCLRSKTSGWMSFSLEAV